MKIILDIQNKTIQTFNMQDILLLYTFKNKVYFLDEYIYVYLYFDMSLMSNFPVWYLEIQNNHPMISYI